MKKNRYNNESRKNSAKRRKTWNHENKRKGAALPAADGGLCLRRIPQRNPWGLRAAVWKAITALREQGYVIDSVTNKGYRLVSAPDLLTEDTIRDGLESTLVSEIHALETVDSTNNEAKRWAPSGRTPTEAFFVAEEQTGGKGRLGRVWKSPPKTGLWFSICCAPRLPRNR